MRQAIRTFGWLVLAASVSASAPPETPVADAAQRGDLDAPADHLPRYGPAESATCSNY